jgi:NhaP-type Na+/H+ or K+/H+ antiporter
VLASTVAGIAFTAREPAEEAEKYEARAGIELIITMTYFIFFGAILPYHQWGEIGVWRLALFSLAVIFLRRMPVVVLLSPWISALDWHEDYRVMLTNVSA